MMRDMDLVRAILLFTEKNVPPMGFAKLHPDGLEEFYERKTTSDEIFEHVWMLEKADFFLRSAHSTDGPQVGNLTMIGHDFLDSVRDPEIWRKTKKASEAAGGWTLSLLGDIAKGLIKTNIKKHTGVDV